MPKTRVAPPPAPPTEDLETPSREPSAPKKKSARRAGAQQPASLGQFGSPPRGATHWGLRRHMADGSLSSKLSARSSDGSLIVHEWTFDELTGDVIAARWGDGTYRLEWIGPGPKGQRTHLAWGRDFGIELPAASPPTSPPSVDHGDRAVGAAASPGGSRLAADDPMARAFLLLDAIDRRANTMAERDRAFLQAVITTSRGDSESSAVVRELAGVVRELRAEVLELRSQVTGGDDDEDDDEEEDDDDEDDEPRDTRTFRPGEPITDAAVAAGLNKVAEFLDGVGPGAAAVALEWLQDKQLEMQQRRARQLNGGANGHAAITTTPTTTAENTSEPAG